MGVWGLRLLLLPVLILRDLWRRVRGGTGQSVVPRRMAPWRGGPVAVVALYQSGQVRGDVLSLMLALRRRGVYVLAVNAGFLPDGGARLPADGYVERRNFGRDFGSYRVGVKLARTLGGTPSRLVLLNDSVFYASQGLDAFVDRLVTSRADICSATESTEVLPHQTSFCLSFSEACVAHPAFTRFWDRYMVSDIRPAAVILGEIALSRRLRLEGFAHEALANRHMVHDFVRTHPEMGPEIKQTQACDDEAAAWSVAGNVTHRAPAALVALGVPLVKLDLALRADAAASGLYSLKNILPARDQDDLWALFEARRAAAGRRGVLDRWGAYCGLC